MIILTIRTDKPEAEIGLYDDDQQIGYVSWEGHRRLAETIHETIDSLCSDHELSYSQIQGIVCYKGPGSFTGLRIGLTVGNALAYGLSIPVVASAGNEWREDGIHRLRSGDNEQVVTPEYSAPATTTKPRK